MSDRTARCCFYGSEPAAGTRSCSSTSNEVGGPCQCEVPSSDTLPLFVALPEQEYDTFYCGCGGCD